VVDVEQRSEVRDGMRIDWDVPIAVSDGLVLRADVFRPIDGGPHPVILAYGPYAKGMDFGEGFPDQFSRLVQDHPDVLEGSSGRYHNFEVVDPEKWVPDGYVCVRVDSRGTGSSPGYLCLFQERETDDLYDCVEWAAVQDWSDGKVALSGISYLAMNQWHVASRKPPHLVAMIPWEGAADFYRDATYHGGIRSIFWDGLFDRVIRRAQHGVADRGFVNPNTGVPVAGTQRLTEEELERNRCDFGAELRAHPHDDEFHVVRSARWDQVDVPFLSAANWGGQGLHLRGNVEAFEQAASTQKWLEVHGLEHWTHYYTNYGVALQKQFLGHYLKGEDNGWADRPPVLLQVRTLDGFFERAEDGWPIPRTRWTTFHLDASSLTLTPGAPAADADVGYDATGPGLTFVGEPLEEQTEVTGPLAAKLFVSSKTVDADLFLVLRAFDPDGAEVVFQGHTDPHTPIGQGWLRASHRELDPVRTRDYRPHHRHLERQRLVPGQVYEVDVEIWPTSVVLPAGYRLALSVRGNDYVYEGIPSERAERADYKSFAHRLSGSGPFLHNDERDRPAEIFGSRVTVHTGPSTPSALLVPVIPPA
jgi:predicted acyl esterase